MRDNGLLEHYRSLVSKEGFVDVDKLPMKKDPHDTGYGSYIQILIDDSGKKYFVKKCTNKEQSAEVLLSQVYAKAGFDTAIYLPAGKNMVVSNDVGAEGELAEKFFLRKVAEEKELLDSLYNPNAKNGFLNKLALIGKRWFCKSKDSLDVKENLSLLRSASVCVRYMTPECVKKYFEMRGFDVAAKNSDRHLNNFIFETDNQDMASKLNLFDYGFSGLSHSMPRDLILYDAMINGFEYSGPNGLLWLLANHRTVAEYVNPQQLAEKIGSANIVGAATDITQTTGFKLDQCYVDDIARSFEQTAEDLLAQST